MKIRLIIAGLGVIALALIFVLLRNLNLSSSTTTNSPNPGSPVDNITITAANFSFNPSEIRVRKGDTVKITFKDTQGSHDLVIEGYNLSINPQAQGTETSFSFTADKAGQFNYFCSVDSHRERGMQGTLIVE